MKRLGFLRIWTVGCFRNSIKLSISLAVSSVMASLASSSFSVVSMSMQLARSGFSVIGVSFPKRRRMVKLGCFAVCQSSSLIFAKPETLKKPEAMSTFLVRCRASFMKSAMV